jgi:hypothetical protein
MEGVGKANLVPRLWLFVSAESLHRSGVEHTSRFHVRRSVVYELLNLLWDDLGAAPCRLVFWLREHRRWEEVLGLGLSLLFSRSSALASEAREERHGGTRSYTDPLLRAEW